MKDWNVVGWFEIYVDNLDRAMSFYRDVFQHGDFEQIDMGEEKLAMFPADHKLPDTSGALVKSSNHAPGPGGTMVYFNSSDCSTEAGRAEEAGGKLIREKTAIGEHGFIAMIQDTEGNVIGIHSRD